MDWIRVNVGLPGHPKVRKLSRRLGCSRLEALGHVVAFLAWVGVTREDGNLTGLDAEDVADGAEWPGDPEGFLAALLGAGFVDTTEGGSWVVHDWMTYQGGYLAARDRRRRWKEQHDDGGPSPERPAPGNGTSPERPPNVPGTSPVVPIHTGIHSPIPSSSGRREPQATPETFRTLATIARTEASDARKHGDTGTAARLERDAARFEAKALGTPAT